MRLRRAFVGAVTIAALTAPPSLAQIPPQPPGMQGGGAASPIQPVPQQPGRRGVDDSVTLNFVNADIQAVIKAAAEITNRNILIDPRVTGTVNIVAPKPVPRAMVFSILLSALRAQGFAAVGGESGIVRIVPEAEAKFFPSVGDARTARGDQVVTQVFQLQHESAQQMVPILRPLVSPNNVINAFPASNTLIITDYAENLHRIARVIASVDQPNPGELVSIRVQHANALDIAQTIGRLVPEAAAPIAPGAAPKLAVTVDSRSNTLLIRADNPSLAGRIRTIVTTLDTPGTVAGNIHVVYLKNAEAAKVAEALRGILTGQASQRAATPTTGFGGAPTTGGGIGGLGGAQQPGGNQPGLGGAGGLGGLGGGAAGIGSTFGQPGAAGGQGGQQQQGFQGGGVMVQAYPETNSLVIVAPDHLYNQLRGVIEKLDARRAQIYVEALIVEVSASTAAEFGIQWQDLAGAAANGTRLIGGTNFSVTPGSNIIQGAQNPGSLGPGLNLGVVRGTINIPGISGAVLNLGVLARALETNAGANILSTPTLLTLDNEEAKIIVGQNIPIVTGSFTLNTAGGAGAQNPFQTFDRRDVGLSLRVKPQVTEGGSVKLQIAQEVSSLVQSAQFNAQSVITNKRAIESTVIVDDGQIVVLGGLISDDVQNTAQGVPGLSKIPFIGGLFRYEQRQRQKTNLMVFLRPFIIRDNEQQQAFTGERYDYIRGVQQTQQPDNRLVLPDMPPPNLPAAFSKDARSRNLPPSRPRGETGGAQGQVQVLPEGSAADVPTITTREIDLRERVQPQAAPAAPRSEAPAPVVAPPVAVAAPAPQPTTVPRAAAIFVTPPAEPPAPVAAPAPEPMPITVIPPPAAAAPAPAPAAAPSRAGPTNAQAPLPTNVFLPRDPITGLVDSSALTAPTAAPGPVTAAKPRAQPRNVQQPRKPPVAAAP